VTQINFSYFTRKKFSYQPRASFLLLIIYFVIFIYVCFIDRLFGYQNVPEETTGTGCFFIIPGPEPSKAGQEAPGDNDSIRTGTRYRIQSIPFFRTIYSTVKNETKRLVWFFSAGYARLASASLTGIGMTCLL
jgi:hypothetical protein